jgi:hypothetical protein
MRLDLTLKMERPQAVVQKRSEKKYKNVRSALSREKEDNEVVITRRLSIQTIGCIWAVITCKLLGCSIALWC